MTELSFSECCVLGCVRGCIAPREISGNALNDVPALSYSRGVDSSERI